MSAVRVASLDPSRCVLQTARLELRLVEEHDAAAYFPLMSDAELTRFLAWEPHADQAQTAAVLRALVAAREGDRGVHWAVRLREGTLVGLVSLIDLKWTHLSWRLERGELAYWIAPAHQGRGLATEAARAVVDFGLRVVGLHKILVAHAVGNGPSGGVARRLGFRSVGCFRQAFEKEGQWHDLHYYERLQQDPPSEDKP